MVLLGDDTSFEQAVLYKGYINYHKPFMIQTNRVCNLKQHINLLTPGNSLESSTKSEGQEMSCHRVKLILIIKGQPNKIR